MLLLYFVSLMAICLKDIARSQDPLCDSGEYLIDGYCCPMCDSGNRVHRPCTATISGSTSCIPCMSGTYMDQPSGLDECFKCKSCDLGSGLRVKSSCTYTRNTVCACMDGYYCLTPASEDCEFCERQTVCNTGEKVKVYGTERTNTVCEKCPHGTFSNQTMSKSCITWKSCLDLNKEENKRGTHSSDSDCGEDLRSRIASAASFVLSAASILLITIYIKCAPRKREKKGRKTETAKEPLGNRQVPVQETQDSYHAEMGAEQAIDCSTTISSEPPQCAINVQVLSTNVVSAVSDVICYSPTLVGADCVGVLHCWYPHSVVCPTWEVLHIIAAKTFQHVISFYSCIPVKTAMSYKWKDCRTHYSFRKIRPQFYKWFFISYTSI